MRRNLAKLRREAVARAVAAQLVSERRELVEVVFRCHKQGYLNRIFAVMPEGWTPEGRRNEFTASEGVYRYARWHLRNNPSFWKRTRSATEDEVARGIEVLERNGYIVVPLLKLTGGGSDRRPVRRRARKRAGDRVRGQVR